MITRRPSLLHADLRAPASLLPEERAAWRAWQAAHPAFASPLLSPTFADMVGRVRDDVSVAVFRDGAGEIVGVLPHHRRPSVGGALARGLGGPWSDEQALLTGPGGLDGKAALRAAGLRAVRFTGLVDPHGVFEGEVQAGEPSYAIVLDGTPEAYLERQRAASPKRFKNLRRLDSKLERERGPIELVAGDEDPAALRTVLGWKREQFHRTGVHDVLGPAWSRAYVEELFRSQDVEARGLLITLRAGGQVIAGHFGLRSADTYHPQIAAFDPAFAAYSPGIVLIARAIRAMSPLGLGRYELSGGCGHYKAAFASEALPLQEGQVSAGGSRRPARTSSLLRRAERRFERIVETELTFTGRLGGIAGALQGLPRRFANKSAARLEEA